MIEDITKKIKCPEIQSMIYAGLSLLTGAFSAIEKDGTIEWDNHRMHVGYLREGFCFKLSDSVGCGREKFKAPDVFISKGERGEPRKRSILIVWDENESDDK
jgi:hypothetical protein